jgi:hypothetical protein
MLANSCIGATTKSFSFAGKHDLVDICVNPKFLSYVWLRNREKRWLSQNVGLADACKVMYRSNHPGISVLQENMIW